MMPAMATPWGGIVNIVTKSGANNFHGELYEYLENGVFNANNFENNFNGVPRQDTHQHQYGGTFGGPVVKNKAFFFGSFEGYWENIPFTTLTSVPPANLRFQPGSAGIDFSQTGYTIYDPLTTVCNSGGTLGNCPGNNYSRTAFPNDTIPANRISAAGAALLNLFPLPNINTSSLVQNYIASYVLERSGSSQDCPRGFFKDEAIGASSLILALAMRHRTSCLWRNGHQGIVARLRQTA